MISKRPLTEVISLSEMTGAKRRRRALIERKRKTLPPTVMLPFDAT